MAVIKLVERINLIGPDIAVVVNSLETPIPLRLYISNENLEQMFGDAKKASDHVINRLKIVPKLKELYQIAFLFGDVLKDERDIFVYPFSQSRNPKLVRAEPYLIKNGVRQSWIPRFKGEFGIFLGAEEIHRITRSFEEFINNFPQLPFHRYIDNKQV